MRAQKTAILRECVGLCVCVCVCSPSSTVLWSHPATVARAVVYIAAAVIHLSLLLPPCLCSPHFFCVDVGGCAVSSFQTTHRGSDSEVV